MSFDWSKIDEDPLFLIRLFYWIESEEVDKFLVREASVAGIRLRADRSIFTEGLMTISGRKWEINITMVQSSNRTSALPIAYVRAAFHNTTFYISEIKVKGRDHFMKDMTLLRMFDIEALMKTVKL